MNCSNKNSETLVSNLSDLFEDLDFLPDGEIKDALIELRKMDEKIKEKKKTIKYNYNIYKKNE